MQTKAPVRTVPFVDLSARRLLLLLVLSFLALRLGTLLTSVEYVAWDEELYRGTIAKEIVEGLKVPLWDYQADRYDGGSLAVGVLAVPFFRLFGPNLFALKLVPLCFSLATLILTILFFQRFFDRRAALLAGALLVLPPPVLTALSLSAIGSHPESFLFSIAMLFCFYQFLYGARYKTLSLFLFGLVSGLGFWFTSITAITLLTCLMSWFLLDRRLLLGKRVFVFLGAFLMGVSPLLVYNVTHHFNFLGFLYNAFLWKQGLTLQDDYVSLGEKLLSIPPRMAGMVLQVLPSLFRFRSSLGVPDQLLTLLYGLIAWPLIGLFLWREGRKRLSEKTKLLPFLLFPFLYIFIYSASNYFLFPVWQHRFSGYRYLTPLLYFSLLLIALALRKKKSLLPLSALLILGMVGQGSMLFKESWGRAFRYQGYTHVWLGYVWGNEMCPFPERFEEFQQLSGRFGESQRRYIYWGQGRLLGWVRREVPKVLRMEEEPESALRQFSQVPQEYRIYFIEDWGRHLSTFRGENFHRNASLGQLLSPKEEAYFYYGLLTKTLIGDPHGMTESHLSFLKDPAPSHRHFYYFDLGRCLYWELKRPEPGVRRKATIDVPDTVGPEERVWVYRGLGAEAAFSKPWAVGLNDSLEEVARRLSFKDQAEFYWGAGWGLRSDVLEDRTRALDWLNRIPARMHPFALRGFQEFERWYRIAPER